MSATRLLMLGVLRIFQPAHGYVIRRELESWNAEDWANIAYGSIYFALRKMEEEGLIRVHDTTQEGRRPTRTAYVLTEAGEEEYQRLLRAQWWEYKPLIDPFMVAFSFMEDLPHDELLASLRHHAAAARLAAGTLEHQLKAIIAHSEYPSNQKPAHVPDMIRLMQSRIAVEIAWTEEMIGKVERGELPASNTTD
jgi:DNA-binding PadR family transcriptional regulator